MKRKYGWVSEYRRKKFFERHMGSEKKLFESLTSLNDCKVPKTIAVMLDLGGTSDFIDDEKAKCFIGQLEKLREKFGAEIAFICISTHYDNANQMKKVLAILSRNLSSHVEIGCSFYLGGSYDYQKGEDKPQKFNFNFDKVETFDDYYVSSLLYDNQWFALIDDGISDDVYTKYQNHHPMLLALPSQNEKSMARNNFMRRATTTFGFDGVIELIASYLNSINHLTPNQILSTQQNMIMHLSSQELEIKVNNRDYAFLERYFKEGYADDADYDDVLWFLRITNYQVLPSKEELVHLQGILDAISQYFQLKNQRLGMNEVLKLQRFFGVTNP